MTLIDIDEENILEDLLHLISGYYITAEDQLKANTCKEYLQNKLEHFKRDLPFSRYDKESIKVYKEILFNRLQQKQPQTVQELLKDLPEAVGCLVLEELTYEGGMYLDENRKVRLKKKCP